jgi:hypothetical protein
MERTGNSFPSIVVCIRVYKAVACQCVDQICYNMNIDKVEQLLKEGRGLC